VRCQINTTFQKTAALNAFHKVCVIERVETGSKLPPNLNCFSKNPTRISGDAFACRIAPRASQNPNAFPNCILSKISSLNGFILALREKTSSVVGYAFERRAHGCKSHFRIPKCTSEIFEQTAFYPCSLVSRSIEISQFGTPSKTSSPFSYLFQE